MKFIFVKIIFFFLFIEISLANENIKFININYIVLNSVVGKNLEQIIKKKNKDINLELNSLGKKLEDKKNKITSQKNVLKKEQYDNLVKNYDLEVRNFKELQKKKTNEFTRFRINSKKKIIDTLNPIITDYLRKESIQILLQKDKIIFGDEKLDITEEILKIFNDKNKKLNFE